MLFNDRNFLSNLLKTQHKQRCEQADKNFIYWYNKQSQKPLEQLKREVNEFMTYYENTDTVTALPVSILVAQKILAESKC